MPQRNRTKPQHFDGGFEKKRTFSARPLTYVGFRSQVTEGSLPLVRLITSIPGTLDLWLRVQGFILGPKLQNTLKPYINPRLRIHKESSGAFRFSFLELRGSIGIAALGQVLDGNVRLPDCANKNPFCILAPTI